MDLFGIIGACLRRWYVMIPLIAVAGFFAFQSYQSVESSYKATVSVVVLPSVEATSGVQEEEDSNAGNPYSGQGGTRFAVAVLARNINSTTFTERLNLAPGSGESVEAVAATAQPILLIEATAENPDDVYGLLERSTSEAAAVLDEVQATAGAPESTRYRLAPAVPAGDVEDVTPSRVRSAGAILVVGLGLSAALVTALDALLSRRKRRRKPRQAVVDSGQPQPDPSPSDAGRELRRPAQRRLERSPHSEVIARRPPRLGLPRSRTLDADSDADTVSSTESTPRRDFAYNNTTSSTVGPNRIKSTIDPSR